MARPAPSSTAARVLRVVCALMLLGAARSVHLHGSPITSVLWHDLGMSEAAFTRLDLVAGYVLYGSAAAALLLRGRALAWSLGPAALWLVLVPLATLRAGGDFGYVLAPFSQGNRPLALLALGLLAARPRDRAAEALAVRLLVFGLAFVFAAHGVEALAQHPRFVDYLLVSVAKLTPFTLPEGSARLLLYPIGVTDVVVAGLVLRGPSRRALAWACVWGLLTASMRLVYFGPVGGAHHAAIRAVNGGGALVLLAALQAGLPYPRGRRWGRSSAPGDRVRA